MGLCQILHICQATAITRIGKLIGSILVASSFIVSSAAVALPPASDTPEEVLRTEIETEARSITDGQPLTIAEYAELEAKLQAGPGTPAQLDSQVRHIILLLQVRKMLKTMLPF